MTRRIAFTVTVDVDESITNEQLMIFKGPLLAQLENLSESSATEEFSVADESGPIEKVAISQAVIDWHEELNY